MSVGILVEHCGICGAVTRVRLEGTGDGITMDGLPEIDMRPKHAEWHERNGS